MFFYRNYLLNVPSVEDLAFLRTTRLFLSGMVSHNVACINWAFKNRVKKGNLMFVGEAYWKWVYLLNSKCFIFAVCMVLRGNICSSGFYSDDFHVRGLRSGAVKKKKACRRQTVSSKAFAAQSLRLWTHPFFLFSKVKKITKRITTGPLCCYLLYLQSHLVELCNIYRGILVWGWMVLKNGHFYLCT